MFGRLKHEQRLRRQVEDVLVGAGCYEAYTYSLQAERSRPGAIELPVPLSSQQRVLRTTSRSACSARPGTTSAVGNDDVALFEVAHVYLRRRAGARRALAPRRDRARRVLGAKGIVEAVFDALQVEPRFERARPSRKRSSARRAVGLGRAVRAVRPRRRVERVRARSRRALRAVPERILYRDVITYPPLRLDLAFVVDEHVPAGELLAARARGGGEELREVRFLSDYRGDQIPAGKKSVAYSFAFQSPERTLSDEDAARLRDAIVRALGAQPAPSSARSPRALPACSPPPGARARRSARRRRAAPRRCSSARAAGSRRRRATPYVFE